MNLYKVGFRLFLISNIGTHKYEFKNQYVVADSMENAIGKLKSSKADYFLGIIDITSIAEDVLQ